MANAASAVVPRRVNPPSILQRRFYLMMCAPIVAVVVYGFSFTIDRNLIHPAIPRPKLLYFHAAVFTLWLVFFVVQSALVQTRRTAWHKKLGWFGAVLGLSMPIVGVATAIVMTRFDMRVLHISDADSDMMIPLFDMVCFGTTLALAIWYRGKPEYHRRLMLVATCALTAAGWGRFPEWMFPPYLFYAGVDLLILMGVARDWIVTRSVHPVYRWVLPLFIAGQTIVSYEAFTRAPGWRAVARVLLG